MMIVLLRHIAVWVLLFSALSAPRAQWLIRYWRLEHSGAWTLGSVQAQTFHRQVTFSGSEQESVNSGDFIEILIFGNSGYTQRDERERVESSAGMAGVPSLSP
jgi:hypothetical protein